MECSLALLESTHWIQPKPPGHSTETWPHWWRMDHTLALRQGPRSDDRQTKSNVYKWFAQNVKNGTVWQRYCMRPWTSLGTTIFHKVIFFVMTVLLCTWMKPTFQTYWHHSAVLLSDALVLDTKLFDLVNTLCADSWSPSTHHQNFDEVLLNPRLLFLLQGRSWKLKEKMTEPLPLQSMRFVWYIWK